MQDAAYQFADIDHLRRLALAVEGESLLGNLRNSAEFRVGEMQVALRLGIVANRGAQDVKQIDHRLERIIDLMRDSGSQAAGGGGLFRLHQREAKARGLDGGAGEARIQFGQADFSLRGPVRLAEL